jgi:hypothetical protein
MKGDEMSTIFLSAAQQVFGRMKALIGRAVPGERATAWRAAVAEPEYRRAPRPGQGPGWENPASKDRRSEQLESPMLHVVRRALLKDEESSALTGRIHALAQQLGGPDWSQAESQREALVRQVAREICHAMKKS